MLINLYSMCSEIKRRTRLSPKKQIKSAWYVPHKKKKEKGQNLSQALQESSMKLLGGLGSELRSTTQEPAFFWDKSCLLFLPRNQNNQMQSEVCPAWPGIVSLVTQAPGWLVSNASLPWHISAAEEVNLVPL